ncbi:SusC/RagA family TonB-linked outer membrane protein [Sediminibacterium soli]|uniref:SusC/RagA family TonB-linked outer membrane protein n=1 Tax=Sediminibacterium soli TaxID=2698829 RepID=UPI00192A45F1|nr:TonB-dependent receptor [Sediminibacterium soli]
MRPQPGAKQWLRFCFVLLLAAGVSVLLPAGTLAQAQRKTVTGQVTNEKGEPVSGASVTVKGSNTGTTSDARGAYSLQVAGNNATLVFSFVGYEDKELRVGSGSTVNAQLVPANRELDQVIVVGYGTQRKRDVTGSVISVSEKTLKEVPAPNVIGQLKGRAAGVTIVSNGSTPGAGGSIRIRGNRTLTTSQSGSDALDGPLLVVDGIPFSGSINDINPEDISSLEILKDASATAIFGSRGSGGVILVSTKRGRSGKAVFTYDAFHGITNIMGKYKVMNGAEYAKFKTDAALYNRSTWPTSAGTSSYFLTGAEQAALAAGVSTNWQDLIYKTGFSTSHVLGLTGGNEGTQYGMSLGYYREDGIIPNQNFQRATLRATIDHKIGSRVRIGLNTLNTLSYSNTPGGGGVPSGLVRLTPLASPYNADGTVNINPAVGSIDAQVVSPLTLITKANSILARNRRLRTFNTLYGEVQIINGLKYRLNIGLSFDASNGSGYNGPLTYTNTATVQSSSNASVTNAEQWNYNIQHLLTYNRTFAQKHRLDFTGLFEVIKDHNQGSGFTVTGVPADYIQNANFGLASGQPAVNAGATYFSETGLLSYMGRLNYGFDNRFNITGTVRVDGASQLAPGHKYFTYPAFGAGWTISNEKFMKDVSFISNLKLRGGWGISGNRNVGAYATLGALSANTYNFGTSTQGQQLAYTVTSLANNTLTWQSTAQTDIGLDFGLFNNRITGTVEWYHQQTKDILLGVALPPSNGAGSTNQNLGRTEGRGLEISLSTLNIQAKSGFTWSTDFVFYYNREKITQLTTPDEKQQTGNGWFVGQPLTVIYDLRKIGIWQLDDSAKGTIAAQTSPIQYPGQVRVQDLNGDGKIDANDRQVIGNYQPNWEGGITNRFSYKGFDLSIVMYARMGMKVLVPYITADGGANGFPFFNQSRVNQVKTDYWTRTNPTNAFPAPDAGTDRLLFGSTLGYMDGSFIKCRSINLGYEIPSSILRKTGISSVRVYLNTTNPFVVYAPFVKNGFGPDPEGNGYGGAVNAQGTSESGTGGRQISVNLNNPPVRQFTVGLNVKF